ncbi:MULTISPECIES: hypothetical protein [Streptomyces]|uniref:hypothetical protein n=1 Tax=Streptomyces TaxID=1883 RepID=UPI0015FF745C|nr:hypothetical protein [Streptomyces murinus]MBA9050554.1 hypothetical protein [Streptomyces murinus]
MRQTRLLVLAATGAVLTLTAACGANSAADKSAGSQQKMKTVAMQLPDAKVRASWPKQDVASGLAKGMRLPLEKYMLGYPDMVDIENAKDVVKSACMKRLGFSYTPELMGTQPAASYNEMNMERRYGITDPAKAAGHGFAVAQDTGGPSQADQDAELAREDQESSAEGWDKAMNDTCIPEANQKVGVILPEDPAGDLAGQSLKATRSRPDVQRALSTWSSCMAGHGHRVKSMDEAEGRFGQPGRTGVRPEKAEVSLATADVTCKGTAGLVPTWYQAETAYQNKQITSHKAQLEAAKARDALLLKKARAVLASVSTAH